MKMIKIAHRGNYAGKNYARENTISYIEEAISAGYDVEIDVWLVDHKWHLGHDFPREEIPLSFMERSCVWTHAKNLIGYVSLYNNSKVHTFWHNKDEFVFTSKGIKWAYSGVVTNDGVMVMPDTHPHLIEQINLGIIEPLGICSDNFQLYK
jgi:hypothetical protein